MRDYRLHSLHEESFEELVRHICREILGVGTLAFSKGRDGGKDGRFEGIAERYPSSRDPWKGKFVIQAKHTGNPIAKCSDRDFWENKTSVLAKEKKKLIRLRKAGEVDNYLLFTNRALTAGIEKKIVDELQGDTGIDKVAILGLESLTEYLNQYPAIVRHVGLELFGGPIRFNAEDIKRVVLAFQGREDASRTESGEDYEYVEMERKNALNNLRREDFEFIQENSEPYFAQIRDFLGHPINEETAVIYRDIAAEMNHKIHSKRDDFGSFSEVFELLYDRVVKAEPDLRPRELIWVFLHFMYVHCDLGRK